MFTNNLGWFVLMVANGYGQWKVSPHGRVTEGMVEPSVYVHEVGHEKKQKQLIGLDHGYTSFKLSEGAIIWIRLQVEIQQAFYVENVKLVVVSLHEEKEEEVVLDVNDGSVGFVDDTPNHTVVSIKEEPTVPCVFIKVEEEEEEQGGESTTVPVVIGIKEEQGEETTVPIVIGIKEEQGEETTVPVVIGKEEQGGGTNAQEESYTDIFQGIGFFNSPDAAQSSTDSTASDYNLIGFPPSPSILPFFDPLADAAPST